ncbi:virulence protein RhuM/Fic/DOC family protein [bacterium]|nr:virulence protein RhuM/Fic/DOC family protein [bacterium]
MRIASQKSKTEIIIYKKGGRAKIDVRLSGETIWLSLTQIAGLFERDKSVIAKHIRNIYKEKELQANSTVALFATVQKEGKRLIERQIDHYNLDLIISVGYRVNSKRGTQFRIWANKVIKDYLVKGYVVDEKRLKEKTTELDDLKKTVHLLTNVIEQRELDSIEATGLLRVISDYAYALDVLDRFDHQSLEITHTKQKEVFKITYEEAIASIDELGRKGQKPGGRGGFFGKEKDESFKSSLNAIYQTYDGRDLYSSLEEKAAHLLYFVIKNHSFIDGNKRIAAFLFVWFLQRNDHLYSVTGKKRIADNALVALCLMIAASKPAEKDIMIKVIVNLINKNN